MDWVIYALLGAIIIGILGLFIVLMKNSSRLTEIEERQREIDKLKNQNINHINNAIDFELAERRFKLEHEENEKLRQEVYDLRLQIQRAMDYASGVAQQKE